MVQKGTTAARRIPMTVTFLELTAKSSALPPPQPRGKVALLKCDKPPTHFYRYLYDTIGEGYYWVDRKRLTPEALAEVIHDPRNQLFVLYVEGSPAGMAELDLRKPGTCNIAYFGLMPEAIGKRLGYFFLYHTCVNAWLQPIERLTVNTCTLDHPRALPLYQRLGFTAYNREERFVELP
ncbi:MAG TPA: GNAT family N-acetyltransferase [Rhizomicrobium sp.]|nr:GNAT family N-acetyltransferase [Rhizomicrobium sp.]